VYSHRSNFTFDRFDFLLFPGNCFTLAQRYMHLCFPVQTHLCGFDRLCRCTNCYARSIFVLRYYLCKLKS
jgi:hypothetical protein